MPRPFAPKRSLVQFSSSWLLVLAGATLILLALQPAWSHPSPDVGSIPGAQRQVFEGHAASPVHHREGPDGLGSRLGTVSEKGPRVPIHSGRLADLRQSSPGPFPVRVLIPSIAVETPVVPVGVEHHSMAVEIPNDVSVTGWYQFGPTPGRPGSAVIVGHVDARSQGPGAFFRLSVLEPGDRVAIEMSDGTVRDFSVVARREYPKTALPRSIFRRTGPPLLALVTCGGPFDERTRHYRDNLVVYAVPTDRSPESA
jgi:hypothetical protein